MDALTVDSPEGNRPKPNNRLARRARSFKEDLLEKINNMKTPHVIRSHSPAKRSGKSLKHARRELASDQRASPSKEFSAICKQVELSLQYYQDVVQKGMLEMLPGSTTAVLETVVQLHMLLMSQLSSDASAIVSATAQLHQALAGLVSWSNNVVLLGVPAADSCGVVVHGVRSAVQTLLRLAAESASGDAARYSRTVDRAERRSRASAHRNSLPDLSQDPPAIVHCGPHYSLSNDCVLEPGGGGGGGGAPPKPPLSGRPASVSDAAETAPPLPPKRRSATKLAASTPMHAAQRAKRGSWDGQPSRGGGRPSPLAPRRPGGARRNNSVGGAGSSWSPTKSPDTLSPASSLDSVLNHSQEEFSPWNKHGSYSSIGNSSGSSTRDSRLEADSTTSDSSFSALGLDQYGNWLSSAPAVAAAARRPDINAITRQLRELSAAPDPAGGSPASSGGGGQPRPESGFVSLQSLQSQASAASAAAGHQAPAEHTVTLSVPPALPPKRRSVRGPPHGHYDNVPAAAVTMGARVPESVSMDGVVLRSRRPLRHDHDDSEPPPLPMKKKHVQSYMEMLGDYCQPSAAELLRQSALVHRSYAARWSRREFAGARSCTVAHHLRSSSDDSGEDAFQHTPLVEELSPPALPPKRRSGSMPRQLSSPPPLAAVETPPPPPTPTAPAARSPPPRHGSTGPASPVLRRAPASASGGAEPEEPPPTAATALDALDVQPLLVMKQSHEEGPELRGGPIDALVAHATKANRNAYYCPSFAASEEQTTDFIYQEAFLTTYRTFLTSEELVERLLYRYHTFQQAADTARQRAAKNAFSLLVRVVDDLALSDLTQSLLSTLMEFEVSLLKNGDLMLAKALRSKILEKHETKRRHDNPQKDLPGFLDHSMSVRQSSLLDFKSEQLAEQMTLLDSKLFVAIEIPEVLIWAQEQNEEKSPNLTTFTEHFNKMSYWARTRILKEQEARDREKLILKFIKVMKHLRKMNNFNSYLAILSALDSAPVRRLEWQKQISEALKEYCALIDSSSSFRAYRQALAEAAPPCIPYIGLILQDLTFVHIGNPDLLPDGSINFAKRWQQFNILDNMKRFKKGQYRLKNNEKISQFFDNFDDCISEEEMWRISESIKPRGRAKK